MSAKPSRESLLGNILVYSQNDCLDSAYDNVLELIDHYPEDSETYSAFSVFHTWLETIDKALADQLSRKAQLLVQKKQKTGVSLPPEKKLLKKPASKVFKHHSIVNNVMAAQITTATELVRALVDTARSSIKSLRKYSKATKSDIRGALVDIIKGAKLEFRIQKLANSKQYNSALRAVREASKPGSKIESRYFLYPSHAVEITLDILDAALSKGKLGVTSEALGFAVKLAKKNNLSLDVRVKIVEKSLELSAVAMTSEKPYMASYVSSAPFPLTVTEELKLDLIKQWEEALRATALQNLDRAMCYAETVLEHPALKNNNAINTVARRLYDDFGDALDEIDQDASEKRMDARSFIGNFRNEIAL
ncbi:MAG: hypothetical protein AAF988_03905 [Pseudomonadota bacterium]